MKKEEAMTSSAMMPTTEFPFGGRVKQIGPSLELSRGAVMKTLIILAVLSTFMLGSMAYATETRVWTMGEANGIVKDEANIWLYPSTINYYPNLFIGEYSMYGMCDLYEVGGHLVFGEASGSPQVLGFYFSQEEYQHEILSEFYDYEAYDDDAGRGINLFYGRELGGMPFGLFVGYWFDSYKNEDSIPSNNYEWGMSRYEFKVGLSPMMQQLDISGGIAITSWTDKWYYNSDHGVVDITKPDGNMDLTLQARYWMTPMGKYTLIPHGGVRINNQGLEWYAEDSNEHWVVDGNASLDNTAFGLGLGMNYDAGADILVVGDFGFAYEKEKIKIDFADADYAPWDYEEETGYTILPYFKLGIDAHVFNWMNLRAGVMTIWERWNHTRNYTLYDYYEWDTGAVDRSDADPYTYTYLGGGFHWGNFSIDACVNPEFLGNGPYFITGENTDGFADRVSLKYDFLANHRDQ